MSVVIKQALAAVLVDSAAVPHFAGKLSYYMQVPPAGRVPGILRPFAALWKQAPVLTYGHAIAGNILVGGVVAVLLLGFLTSWRARTRAAGRDGFILLASALFPVAWFLLLPTHTLIHADLEVRALIAPISLAPLIVWWTLRAASSDVPTGH